MTITYYLDENGIKHATLPRLWRNRTPVTWETLQGWGWQLVQEEIEEEEPDHTARNAAEKAIVGEILKLANDYEAVTDLMELQDITIPSLLELANNYEVAPEDLQKTETSILILARHLEAINRSTWAETWDGLKSRFGIYLAELLQNEETE